MVLEKSQKAHTRFHATLKASESNLVQIPEKKCKGTLKIIYRICIKMHIFISTYKLNSDTQHIFYRNENLSLITNQICQLAKPQTCWKKLQ